MPDFSKTPIASTRSALAKSSAQGGRKRVFIGLLSSACVAVCLFLLLFLIVPWVGGASKWLGIFSVAAGLTGIILLSWLCLTLVWHLYTGKNPPGIAFCHHLCARIFLPLMEVAGRVAGVDKTIVRRSFIKVNNEFVMANVRRIKPDKLLLLLPHCVQATACVRRVGPDLSRCASCGSCQIGAIKKLASELGVGAAIATGGTVARRIIAESRPECIVAVACERDLASGIQDSYPIPVFGVLNERPHGPCRDTLAPMPALDSILRQFLDEKA